MAHQLKLTSTGFMATVELDGIDVTSAVNGVDLCLRPGEPARVDLQVVAMDYTSYDGEARVHLPEETKELLKRLGWTPPPEDGG